MTVNCFSNIFTKMHQQKSSDVKL